MSLLKLLSTNGFISYNKTVANKLGVHEAILLGELCSIGNLYNYNEFYFERSKIINDTALSDSQIRNATKTLIQHNLIEVVKKGIPCKYYYTLNEENILNLFRGTDTPQQEIPSATKIGPLEVQNLQDKDYNNCTTFNNKNTNKDIDSNNTISPDGQNLEDSNNLDKPNNQLFGTTSKPKKKGENQFITVIEQLSGNEQVRVALQKYCGFRRKRGLTIEQWQLMVEKFKQDSKGKTVKEVVDCIEQCVLNGRNSLYYTTSYVQQQDFGNIDKPNYQKQFNDGFDMPDKPLYDD